ncbi:MAG: hypothetical protein M2R45_00290 [Verrucomicrobia subdivision 3 bacterium]|nr:hypothetical protein [Limisphaerales bacterium]MCS1412950.1 hypothetical protein [Limisphaerales bacterium]
MRLYRHFCLGLLHCPGPFVGLLLLLVVMLWNANAIAAAVSKTRLAIFLPAKNCPGVPKDQIDTDRPGTEDAVEWLKTVRGVNQHDLISNDNIRVELRISCDAWEACE